MFTSRLNEFGNRVLLKDAEEISALETIIWLLYTSTSTKLYREFPELQFKIGGILAREEGYPEVVWRTIYEYR